MNLIPCTEFPDEFIVEGGSDKDVLLATAVGASTAGVLRLTQARARKFASLRNWGFSAELIERRWRFRRGASRLLTLDHAMLCIEVMSAPLTK